MAANIIMALLADFMLVWLPAPTFAPMRASASASSSALARYLAACPENAFQKVPYGTTPFTLAQRATAVLRNGTKLLGVGFAASMVGVVATNTLIAVRKALDPSFKTLNPPQDPLATSALYGLYMASSSNIRYQILAGVLEERIVETVLSGKPGLTTAISFILRTGNTFLGSLLWVDFVRLFGMQKAKTNEVKAPAPSTSAAKGSAKAPAKAEPAMRK